MTAIKKLLPHQFELLKDNDTRILGLVSGYGAGKTYAVARKAIVLMSLNAGYDGVITEPTYPMLADILIPEVESALIEYGIRYSYNRSEKTFKCEINGKDTRILCRSMENYERLVGVNAAWVIMDEADTAKPDIAYNAYTKLIGRIRAGNRRQMVIVSTPEGFRMLYRVFVTEADERKRLIRAKSSDNKHLPPDYLQTLIGIYPEELQQAYINGEFVNMTSGTVYNAFSRERHDCKTCIAEREPLYIGQDFNVGNMCSAVFVRRGEQYHLIEELNSILDTPELCNVLLDKYPDHEITIYPDASGANRKTVGASTSDIKLLKAAGFKVRAKSKNPPVKDRVLAVNCALSNGLVCVNTDACREITKGLEQQAYDRNGQPDKTTGLDHFNDALGYLIAYEFPVERPKVKPAPIVGMF